MIQLTTDRARHSRKTNDNMRVPHDRGAITTRGPTQNKPVTWQTEWRTRSKTRQRAMHIRKLAIRQKENRVADICNAVSVRSEADAINLNQILLILILSYLYINILQPFFINCKVWKFSKIRPMPYKCRTNFLSLSRR